MQRYDLSSAQWRKSSYSDGDGGSCVEVAYDFPGAAARRKSSYSDGDGDPLGLPAGATCVDAAYAVHGEAAHACIGARVNGRLAALST
ncbi:DUF397 domain-containing protein, partial [Streptomyces sp. GC420]|uniref:DUF397 domain-containing protein n=1 Tax=Streptomyces sp. GC420 TaxID=2697568 RepID=UPI0014152DBF